MAIQSVATEILEDQLEWLQAEYIRIVEENAAIERELARRKQDVGQGRWATRGAAKGG